MGISIKPLRHSLPLEAATSSGAPGSAFFEGWSDRGRWRIALPWPEEIRTLSWRDAAQWKSLVADIERDAPEEQGAFPFAGGWIGFLTYEAGATVEEARPRDGPPPEPAAFFVRHSSGVVVDPDGNAWLFAPDGSERGRGAQLEALAEPPRARSALQLQRDSLGGGLYARRVEEIREAIARGDVYQVNLTRSLTAAGTPVAASLYRALTQGHSPRSSALIRGDGWSVVSASPEVLLLFDRETGVAESRPIKGTVRRDGADDAEIAALLASDKDAAEHLMIVDVVRNDLGKVAPPGSVSVPHFRTIRTLGTVHHLESTVRAAGLEGRTTADVLEALLPAASITGAPKRAAVQMIREIEPVPRGVYCGSIGMITRTHASFSVAIRTAVIAGNEARFHTGGGIVWDSDGAAEDDECRAKAKAFLDYAGGSGS